jgi:hypothetical protein
MDLEKLTLPLDVADKAFNIGVGAAVAGVTALVGAMGAAVNATFKWAGELDSIQDIIGGTNSEAAALNFTLRKSGTSTETFTKSMTILNKGLVKADGSLDTIGTGLAKWGINVKDVNGKLKTQQQLISDVSKKYNEFGTQQERVNFLTETFGRGGAEMIDFFDTLAAEGGIDAVTKKVEGMGLVIDPARYENFTRSLEELKMVGLGLAVGFTEKVMPAFEKFMGIVTDPNLTFGEKVGALAESASQFVNTWFGELKTKWDEINWDEVTAKIAAKIDGLEATSAGEAFGNWLDKVMGIGIESHGWENVGKTLGLKINDFLLGATGAADFAQPGGPWWSAWDNFFFVWGEQIKAGFGATMQNWDSAIQTWGQRTGQSMITWAADASASAVNAINQWGTNAYNAAIGWVNQLISAFNSIPLLPNGAYQSQIPLKGAGSVKTQSGRASGGPVIGGQTYFAHAQEIFKDGAFTAPSSGRIDPMQPSQGFDMRELARLIGQEVTFAVVPALQKAL